MSLKWIVLLFGLIAMATAQTTAEAENDTMTDPTTMMPTTMMTTTEGAAPTTEATGQEVFNTSSQRYNGSQAMTTRSNHFYCLGENSSRTDFRTAASYRWGIWMQYPVLSYLDTMRKRHLFYAISEIVRTVRGSAIFDDICVAEVEQYAVSTYRESVFVKLYLRGMDDMNALRTLDMQFRSGFNDANSYTFMFRDRLAIDVSSVNPSSGPILSNRTVNDSVHPGCDIDSCPEGDPTLLAVVLGTYVGQWYTRNAVTNEEEEVVIDHLQTGFTGYTPIGNFASNPRPINYGLEPGDIVFAVFGTFFLLVLSGAIILGFCIHPFYLS